MSHDSYAEYVRQFGERAYHVPPDAEFLKRSHGYIRAGEIYVEFSVRGILYHVHRDCNNGEYYKYGLYKRGSHDVYIVRWPEYSKYRGL